MRQPANSSAIPHPAPRGEQVLVFSIGVYRFLISAASVQEIRNTDALGGVVMDLERPAVPKVRHVLERDSISYYVVSGYDHFHLPISRPTTVLILRDAPVALLVDRIEEMVEMRTLLGLPRTFQGEERVWYRGLTVLQRTVVPVVDPHGFLTPQELQLLAEQNPAVLQGESDGQVEKEPV